MYTTYSMVTNLFVNIAIGIIILLILSVVTITFMFWFDSPPEQIAMVTFPYIEHHPLEEAGTSMPLVLKILISCEGVAYIVVNTKMLRKWVSRSNGKLVCSEKVVVVYEAKHSTVSLNNNTDPDF